MSLSTSLSIVNKEFIYRFLSGKLFLKKILEQKKNETSDFISLLVSFNPYRIGNHVDLDRFAKRVRITSGELYYESEIVFIRLDFRSRLIITNRRTVINNGSFVRLLFRINALID